MDDFATGYLAGQDGGNNNGGFFGNEGLWAVIILAIIFGWGNYGNGRNGGDNGMASYIPYLVGTGATGQGGNDTRAALSEGFYQQDTSRSLAGIQSGICSLGYDQLAQMNGLERIVANGDNAITLALMQEGNARQAGQIPRALGWRVRRRSLDLLIQVAQACHDAIHFLVWIHERANAPHGHNGPAKRFDVLQKHAVAFSGGLQSHELRIVGKHGQCERLVVQANYQRQLGTIVETVVDGHIQTAGTNTVGKIVEQYVRTVRLDDWAHHAVIELFRPAKHRFQHLRTSLVQALVIHVS